MNRPALRAAVLISAIMLTLPGRVCAQASSTTPTPGKFTAAQFRGLRFLEGTWKGSGCIRR